MDIETFDIGVSWRWHSNSRAIDRSRAEIILYDRTPGGAVFVKDGVNQWSQVTEKAYQICVSCNCQEACYDCLNSGVHFSTDPHSGVNELIGDAVRSYSEELELVVSQVREKWKNTRIILRGNGGFCREGLMRWCEQNGVDYVLGMGRTSRLMRRNRNQIEVANEKKSFTEFYF